MIRVSNMDGKAAYTKRKPKKKGDEGDVIKKVGKIHLTVFAPGGRRVVGFMVKRPDIALMVARPDVFVAYDSLTPYDRGYLIDGEAATDQAARDRLHLDWDRCIMWNGMDAMTQGGRKLGYVGDVDFDERTGKVIAFEIGDGGAAVKLVGSLVVPVEMMVGYERGFLKLKDEAADLELSGGLAAAAGEASARAKQNAHETGVAANAAVQKGAFALGKAVGRAQRAVAEADAEDEAAASAPAKRAPSGAGASGSAAKKGASAAKKAPSGSKKSSAASSQRSRGDEMARAAGRQIGRFGSMFKDFKDEFDEASK